MARLIEWTASDPLVPGLLRDAGYDTNDDDHLLTGTLAVVSARQLLGLPVGPCVSAVRKSASAGRNDPCPCGSGKKFKKCCLGVEVPAAAAHAGLPNRAPLTAQMIPFLCSDDGYGDFIEGLPELFRKVEELQCITFDVSACTSYSLGAVKRDPHVFEDDSGDAQCRLAASYLERHDERRAFVACRDAALAAAPRYRSDPATFRRLVAVHMFANSTLEVGQEEPDSGLGTFLFWWTLQGAGEGVDALDDILRVAGCDSDAGRRALLDHPERISEMAERLLRSAPRGVQALANFMSKNFDRIVKLMEEGEFPVGVPLATACPLFLFLISLAKRPGPAASSAERRAWMKANRKESQEALLEAFKQTLDRVGPEDQRLAKVIAQEWLDDPANRKHPDFELVEIVSLQCLLPGEFPFWYEWLAGGIRGGNFSAAAWETGAADEVLKGATPASVEQHGKCLLEHGFPTLARVVWESCAHLPGGISASIRAKLDAMDR